MSRDHNPVPGKWYESLDDEEVFRVLSVDEDAELIELQYEDGDVEEIDYETWHGTRPRTHGTARGLVRRR